MLVAIFAIVITAITATIALTKSNNKFKMQKRNKSSRNN